MDERKQQSCSPDQPRLHLTHLGKAPRQRVAKITKAALDDSTSLDPDAVQATLKAIQSVLPEIVNAAVKGFKVRTGPGGTEQTCVEHACTGFIGGVDHILPNFTHCKEEACQTQACAQHTCGTNACGSQSCPSASCAGNTPPPNDNVFSSEAFARVRERLERLARGKGDVQQFSISVDSDTLDNPED